MGAECCSGATDEQLKAEYEKCKQSYQPQINTYRDLTSQSLQSSLSSSSWYQQQSRMSLKEKDCEEMLKKEQTETNES